MLEYKRHTALETIPDNRGGEVRLTKNDYIGIDEWYGAIYKCKLCECAVMEDFFYCPVCGAKVSFNIEED